MKSNRAEVYILTLLLLAVAVVFGTREPWGTPAFSFEAVTDQGTETIQVWTREDGAGFVFLPSYVNLDQLRIQTKRPVFFDGTKMTYGKTCEKLSLDREYPLSGVGGCTSVTFLKSQGLPTLYIDTASGSLEAIHGSKENAEQAAMRLYSATGERVYYGNLDSIKVRGNSTAGEDKKPYNLTLSREEDLLGMGAAANWVLLANAFDVTNLRNKIVCDFAGKAGLAYSPESRWVDLYLNGEYAGLYQLSERNEVHPQRVAISKEGSFLVSMDFTESLAAQGTAYIETGSTEFGLRVRYSDVSNQTIAEAWRSIEAATAAEDGVDPVTGKHWTELIDLDSWVRKYLVEEIFANVDGGRASQFYYRNGADQRLFAGPVWDYDRTLFNPCIYWEFGGTTQPDRSYNSFYVNCNSTSAYYHLYGRPAFYSYMTQVYQRDFLPLLRELSETGFFGYEEQIRHSSRLNQIRWSIPDAQEQTQALWDSIAGRTAFLTGLWLENREYVRVLARYVDRNVEYYLTPGESLSQLPQYPSYDWYDARTGQRVDTQAPLWEPMEIELREKQ
ncbi:MAG: CotH kinase family protein [Eubacteriales bacterium]|nr:CotH kinase family protein [Eubacteriales bacterium]